MGGGTGKTVLVVDDDQSLRLLCRVNLELDGYTVLEATGVGQAKEMLAAGGIDAMLLDLHLGDGDGRDLLASLGADRPPVALFTGSEQIGPALREVADAVLSKPFEIRLLAATVDRLVSPPTGRFRPVTTTGVYTPLDFEARLKQFLFESSEEGRAVRVGEKETSEQAEIVAPLRRSLHARPARLRCARRRAGREGDDREQLYRLRKVCEGGIVSAELVEREDELENRQLAARLTFRGEELPLRAAQAKLAVLHEYARPGGARRAEADLNVTLQRRAARAAAAPARSLRPTCRASPIRSRATRRRRAISLRELARALNEARAASDATRTGGCARSWFERAARPRARRAAALVPHGVRPPALAARGDVHEGARDRRLPRDAEGARLRPRRRPEHQARPRRPAAEGAARLRDRVATRRRSST